MITTKSNSEIKSTAERDLSNLPDTAIIRLHDVLRLYPVSKSKWWDGVRRLEYPKPVHLGKRARGWRLGDILALSNSDKEV